MKRASIAKRRDRAVGMSPYARYNKREVVYSPGYQAWAESYRPCKASQMSAARKQRVPALAA